MRYLRLPKAAQRLDVSVGTIRRYLRDGRLRGRQLPSGHWRVEEASLDELTSPDAEERRLTEQVFRLKGLPSPYSSTGDRTGPLWARK
ncbi:helix-turn-helix domain-containing protein [Desulfovibrio aminophilus]|uniref:helix-turn-helix domain-containing protein n=1 Tax=Desulfovibrio aminophilus TaxID=81425 RepID=UPI00041F6540|nr:helix-turn-helix domain-containing protein [Desulfovibrio aminophilus]